MVGYYIMVPHECYTYTLCQSMHVDLMFSLITRFNVVDLITATSRPPDLFMLTCTFETRCYCHTNDNTVSGVSSARPMMVRGLEYESR